MKFTNLIVAALAIRREVGKNLKQNVRYMSTLGQSSSPDRCAQYQIRTPVSSGISLDIVDEADSHLRRLQPAGSNVELADLECRLPDNRRFTLNLTWLRDSCHCHECTHKFSRQRLFTPKEFRRNLFAIDDVQVLSSDATSDRIGCYVSNGDNDQGYLNIKWKDGHDSFYSLDWLSLLHSLYKEPQIQLGKRSGFRHLLPKDDLYASRCQDEFKPQLWSVSEIQANLRPVDYNDLLDGFDSHNNNPTFINANRISDMSTRRRNSIMSLLEQLTKFGLAKIVNVPQERNQVLEVAQSLAYERPTGYGKIFDVVIEPSEEINLAYSSQEFDLHSDLTYREKSPGVQMLHCIRNSVDGGLSFFSDAFQAAEMLRVDHPELFEVLLQFPALFHVRDPYRDVKFRHYRPILSLNYQGELDEVYYSPFMLPPVGHRNDLKLFYLAQDQITQLLQAKSNKLVTKMDPGDLFIFNNRRVLHGRSSYDPKPGNRFLQGCYMDWDEIVSMREKFQLNERQ